MAKQNFGIRFLTVQEAAEFLRVAVATIYSWNMKRKVMKFPVRYHGRKPVYILDELKAWSDSRNPSPAL